MSRFRAMLPVFALCWASLMPSTAAAQAPATPSGLGALAGAFVDAAEPKEAAAALERALAKASPATRAAMAMEIRRQLVADMQKQADLDAGSAEYRRLDERMDRLQATMSAATGDSRALRTVAARPVPPASANAASASPPNEEAGNLEEQLRSFRARVQQLTSSELALLVKSVRCLNAIDSSYRKFTAAESQSKAQIAGITNRRNDLEQFARAAAAAGQSVRANSAQAADRARDAANLFEGAQAIAGRCVTQADASALTARLDSARAAFGAAITGMGEARRSFALYKESVNGYDIWLPEYELALRQFTEEKQRAASRVQDLSGAVDDYLGLAGEDEELDQVGATLIADLEAAFNYYTKIEPGPASEFNSMRDQVREMYRDANSAVAEENDNVLKGRAVDARIRLQALDLPMSITRGVNTPRPAAADLQAIVDQAEAEVDYVKLLMADESRLRQLAAACGQPQPLNPLNVPAGASPASGPAAPDPPNPPPTPAAPEVENGLLVLGLNRMAPGQFEQFTAADGFERPYAGPVEWNSSVEDVVTIDRRTGEAVAFQPGRTVIIARKGDLAAYFAVTVEAPPAPSAGDAAPGGFESLGSETREVVEPPAPAPIRDFFEAPPPEQPGTESMAQPPPAIDPFEQQRAEEQAREERRRQQGEAMMNLMGVMSGASQRMNDIKNQRRGSSGGGYTPPQPQATWPTGPPVPIYQPPGGAPPAAPGVHTGQPDQPASSGCGQFPANWQYDNAWERTGGQMVRPVGRVSVLAWPKQEVRCAPNPAYSLIIELVCRSTGERRCLGK